MKITVLKNGQLFWEKNTTAAWTRLAITPGEAAEMEISCSFPILDLQGYWVPELCTPAIRLPWVITSGSAGQKDFPYIAFFNSANLNKLSAGLIGTCDDNCFDVRMNQSACAYDLTIRVAASGEPFEFLLDTREVEWLQALADWRTLAAECYPARHFPAAAWDPVYCTWYAVHAAVTQDWVERTAAEAVKLGFKTLIIDDGWCFDAMKRVTPNTIKTWYEMIGDWQVSAQKFPDFAAHVERVKAMGMKYMLWVAPFLAGVRSELYGQWREQMLDVYREGCYLLDTDRSEAMRRMQEKICRLMRDYPIDGLKIDFLDDIAPDLKHPRSRSTMTFIRDLSAAIRQIKSDALIEYRQNYATMPMLPYGTQFRAGDVPFDFTENFHRLCQIRISVGDHVPIHADPVYYHPEESAANIARHMIASLVGVPMLSMELLGMSEAACKVIRNHIEFYRAHQATLNHGKWHIRFAGAQVAYAAVASESSGVLFIHDPAYCREALDAHGSGRETTVFNLSGCALNVPGAQCFAPDGEPVADGAVPPGGRARK